MYVHVYIHIYAHTSKTLGQFCMNAKRTECARAAHPRTIHTPSLNSHTIHAHNIHTTAMVQLEVPHVNVISKLDLVRKKRSFMEKFFHPDIAELVSEMNEVLFSYTHTHTHTHTPPHTHTHTHTYTNTNTHTHALFHPDIAELVPEMNEVLFSLLHVVGQHTNTLIYLRMYCIKHKRVSIFLSCDPFCAKM